MKRLPASFSVDAFKDVWRASRDSGTRAGVDRLRASQFSSQLTRHISDIRESVRAGEYRFRRLRLAPVQKPSGGYRIIAIPTVGDRLLQRVILRHLEADKKFQGHSSISFGFSKGRTLANAQQQALLLRKERPWVVQADIVKFFDRIRRSDIKKLIKKNVRSKIVQHLLCEAVDCELDDGDGGGAAIVSNNGIRRGLGLRQGMPVSPMLSNLLLKAFDAALENQSISAIRYADDIAIFCHTCEEGERALKFVHKNLSEVHLEVPHLTENGKTKIKGPSETVEFLGVDIKRFQQDYKLCAPYKKLSNIKREMEKIVSMEECIKHQKNIGSITRSLNSFIIGHAASMAVLDDYEDFKTKLEAERQKQLKSLLVQLIGPIAYGRLDRVKLAILGVELFD